MLIETRLQSVRDSLAARGIRAWHISDSDAPRIVREYGVMLAEIDAAAVADSADIEMVKGRTCIASPWAEQPRPVSPESWQPKAYCFELVRWTLRGEGAIQCIALHPHATWRDMGWTEDDFDIEGNDEEDGFTTLKEKYGDIDGTGRAPQFLEDLDAGVVLHEFVVAIKRIHLQRDEALIRRRKPALWKMQSGRCDDCRCQVAEEYAHVNHIVPHAWGGDESASNLRIVCPDCSSHRHAGKKKEMLCAWMHTAGIWEIGWTPETLALPGPSYDRIAAWDLARPDATTQALDSGPVDNRKERRARVRRIEKQRVELTALREVREGAEYIPRSERVEPWDRWPEMIESEPMRYAGKDDYEFLLELGEPLNCGEHCDCRQPGCWYNDPKRRSRLRRRLHQVLDKLGWSFGRYTHDAAPGPDREPRDAARRYVPPGCNLRETMGEGFQLGDNCSGHGFAITLTLDNLGNLQIGGRRLELEEDGEPTHAPMPEPLPPVIPEPASDTVLSGLRIAVTGRFEGVQRADLERLIKAGGGTPAKSISTKGKTDYLLAGEKPGSKLAKARAAGVPVLDIDTFRRMLAADSTAETDSETTT